MYISCINFLILNLSIENIAYNQKPWPNRNAHLFYFVCERKVIIFSASYNFTALILSIGRSPVCSWQPVPRWWSQSWPYREGAWSQVNICFSNRVVDPNLDGFCQIRFQFSLNPRVLFFLYQGSNSAYFQADPHYRFHASLGPSEPKLSTCLWFTFLSII